MSRREPGKRKGLPRGRGNLAPQFDSPPPAPPPPPPPRAERLTLASGARHRARPPFHRKCRLLPAGPPLTSPRAASLAAAPPGPTLPPAARSRASQPAAARRGQPAACFPHLQRRRAGCCGACPASLARAQPRAKPVPTNTPRGQERLLHTRVPPSPTQSSAVCIPRPGTTIPALSLSDAAKPWTQGDSSRIVSQTLRILRIGSFGPSLCPGATLKPRAVP